MLRLLVVGLGVSGRAWVSGMLPQVPDVELAGCADLDPAQLRLVVERAGVPEDRCFTDLGAAIAATAPDAVLVATTLPGHAPIARTALDAGLHVLLEKPFAPTLAEAAALVALAERRGLVLMVNQNYRFYPAPRAAAALVAGGSLGRPHAVEIDFRHGPTAPPGQGHRLIDEPLLLDMAIHHADLLRLLLGAEAESVTCETWNPPWSGFAGPPAGLATIRFPTGVIASYRGSWISHGPATTWAGEWRVACERGELWWTSRRTMHDADADRLVVTEEGREAREVTLPAVPLLDRAGCLAAFHAAVRSGGRGETSGRDNLGTLALSLALVESARTGRTVVPAVPEVPGD